MNKNINRAIAVTGLTLGLGALGAGAANAEINNSHPVTERTEAASSTTKDKVSTNTGSTSSTSIDNPSTTTRINPTSTTGLIEIGSGSTTVPNTTDNQVIEIGNGVTTVPNTTDNQVIEIGNGVTTVPNTASTRFAKQELANTGLNNGTGNLVVGAVGGIALGSIAAAATGKRKNP